MMRKILGVVAVLVAVFVMWWNINYPSGTWRYKITVEIETPEGIKSGSAVRQISVMTEPKIFPEQYGFHMSVKGEAVVVDLGARGIVFALIDWGAFAEMTSAFAHPYSETEHSDYGKIIAFYKNMKAGEHRPLPQDKYPKMVMFKDITDPKSVTLVRGGEFDKQKQDYVMRDDFEELFGTGVKLRAITIETTDEPVTWEIEKQLKWLNKFSDKMFDGQRFNTIHTNYPLANSMSSGSFSTGKN